MRAEDPQSLPEFEIAAACDLGDHGTNHFCLVAPAAGGGSFAVLGDVLGDGYAGARAASFLRERCTAVAAGESEPARLLEAANEALLERPPGLRELVSAVCLHYEPEARILSWAIAGHPSPLLLPYLEQLQLGDRSGLLGLDRGLSLTTRSFELPAGFGVLAFTAETVDTPRSGERLGHSGLAEIVAADVDLDARSLARRARRAVMRWSDALEPQDICLLVLRRQNAVSN